MKLLGVQVKVKPAPVDQLADHRASIKLGHLKHMHARDPNNNHDEERVRTVKKAALLP